MSDLPEPDPAIAARRRARRASKLPRGALCAICGVSEPDGLHLPKRVLEDQHVLGEQAAPDVTVWLCRTHHAIATGQQHDQQALPPPGRRDHPDALPETVERILRGLAIFLHALAHALVAWADRVRDFWHGLDTETPGWREQPWAVGGAL